jgi:hypothetical protein
LADDKRVPADVQQRAVEAAFLVLEDAETSDPAGEPFGLLFPSCLATPSRTHNPAPISPTISPSATTCAPETRWMTARTVP